MAGFGRKMDPEVGEVHERPSLAHLLMQDFSRIDDEQLESAARERIRALDHVLGFLLGVHLVCAIAFLVGLGNPASPDPALLAPLGTLIALDFGLWAWLLRRPLSRFTPHHAIRGAALYSLLAYGLWCGVSIAAQFGQAQNATLLDIAVAGGVLALPIAFLSYPALVALGCLGFTAKFWFLTHDPVGASVALLLSVLLVRLSL